MFALIDEADANLVVDQRWFARPTKKTAKTAYAVRTKEDGSTALMHRVILGVDHGQEIDHVNCNGLDNRRNNLRACSRNDNAHNVGRNSLNTSGFKGVSRDKARWRAVITSDGIKIHLGTFPTAKAAVRAYDSAAIRLFGAFARPNFPITQETTA